MQTFHESLPSNEHKTDKNTKNKNMKHNHCVSFLTEFCQWNDNKLINIYYSFSCMVNLWKYVSGWRKTKHILNHICYRQILTSIDRPPKHAFVSVLEPCEKINHIQPNIRHKYGASFIRWDTLLHQTSWETTFIWYILSIFGLFQTKETDSMDWINIINHFN